MATRARKGRILVHTSTFAGKPVDSNDRDDMSIPVFDANSQKYIHVKVSELETDPQFTAWLASNPLQGLAEKNHDHEIGDMTLIFENALI